MELDDLTDPTSLAIGILAWLACVVCLWVLTFMEGFDFWTKVFMTVILLPICVVICNLMINK